MNNLDKLLIQAAKKDPQAFQTLYETTSPKLFALALHLMKYDNEAAEEVLQEAFIKIWNKADKFNANSGSAVTWMRTIVRNQSFDRLRSYKSRPELVEEAEFEGVEYTSNDLQPEQQNSQQEQLALFKQMLEQFSPQQQEVITQSLIKGYSHSEIAENTQLPLGTIKSWLKRCLTEIREAMADKEYIGFKNF